MIDSGGMGIEVGAVLSTSDLHALVERLAIIERPAEDGDAIAQLEALERVKSAAAAAQAWVAHGLAHRQQGSQDDASIGAQIGLARRESPHQGGRHLALSRALIRDLPETLLALTAGDISEARAMIIASELELLGPDDRRAADAQLFPAAVGLGDHQLREHARAIAMRLDDDAAARRHLQARADRRVTGRSLGDGTARITAVVKQEHFATVIGALDSAASSARAAGDKRTHSQVKADTLVERVTGLDPVVPIPVRVDLVVDAEVLLGESSDPGHLRTQGGRVAGGPMPASMVRLLVRRATHSGRATIRRVFAVPGTGELVAMESRRRTFPAALGELISLRDGGRCRTPWCDAPIRHIDHVVPDREGGATDLDNGQGLCERCNYVKEQRGWTHWVDTTHGQSVGILTPAGHVHTSLPPPRPGPLARPSPTRLEAVFTHLVLAA